VREHAQRRIKAAIAKPLTARRAAFAIGIATAVITLVSGLLMHLLVRPEFPTYGIGLWWALQTVTTVGYGDITPTTAEGRTIAAIVMLTGIGFLTVVTAAITAALIESTRKRNRAVSPVEAKLDELNARLDRIEQAVGSGGGSRVTPPAAQR
jgi:voltage-gated potassium channel